MKIFRRFFLIITAVILSTGIYAQIDEDIYYERLYYTCKTWGHAKYYHSEIANGTINWDDVLLNAINGIKTAPDDQAFNDSLLLMLQQAGETQSGTVPLPTVPDSLNNNVDLSWIYAPIFSNSVSELLDTITARLTHRSNVYVGTSSTGNPNFQDYDNQYYSETQYPDEGKRILALFRYWNIIHYFFPYKHIMDQDWDVSLQQAIPEVVNAANALQYHLAMREFTSKINDSHAYMYTTTLNSWRGGYHAPFLARFIEGKVVITKVLTSVSEVKPGDIIKKIDGFDIDILRDSLRKYSYGSNDISIEKNMIEDYFLYGSFGIFSVTIENETGEHTFNLNRSSYYSILTTDTTSEWRTITCNDTVYGIIHMGNLTNDHFPEIISKINSVDAVIFDIRNYPNSTLWTFANYLFDNPILIAKFTKPDAKYPGTFYWQNESIGQMGTNPLQKKVVILFDERTLSQAEYTCMGLGQLPGAIKIGSTTAAADGNVSLIYLPGNISTYATFLGVYYPNYTPTQRIGIIPDYEVHPTIQGIREGRDELLEFAMNCGSMGIDNITNDKEILIYPNPTNDKFYVINDGIASIKLYNMLGQEVLTHHTNGNAIIDISHLPNDIYVVKLITSDNLIKTGKIIKQ